MPRPIPALHLGSALVPDGIVMPTNDIPSECKCSWVCTTRARNGKPSLSRLKARHGNCRANHPEPQLSTPKESA
jgi:hypothetical protein